MHKVVVHRAGGYGELVLEEHQTPAAGPGDVVIAVEAAGVNFADCVVRMGLYASAKEYVGWPITPGFEIAGTVAAVGDGVAQFSVGDNVMAVTRFGGYATEVCVPVELVMHRPADLTVTEAAGFQAVYLTAWYALCELAHPRPSSSLLVHSAAGGVGGALVQLGKALECHVVGVVGKSHKVETAAAHGADDVIDKSARDLWRQAERICPHGFQVVLDANGVSTLRQSYKHLAPGGRLVIYGFHSMFSPGRGKPNWLKMASGLLRTPMFTPLSMTNDNKSVMAFNLSYLFDNRELYREAMTYLCGLLAEEKLRPPPVQTFAFDDVADAHRALESGDTVGKLVLLT